MSKNFSSAKYKTHEEYMKKILKGIFSSDIAPYLAFKGDTLAYFCYDLDRYSTDIDIDMLDLEREQEIITTITALLGDMGEVKNMTVGRDLHRWIFRYDLQSTNIKVELNKRPTTHNRYDRQYIDDIAIPCMEKISMATNKLIALSQRYYNRDLYDTHFFLRQGYSYDNTIIAARTDKNIQALITEIIHQLPSRYADNTILEGMGDVLTDTQKARVKSHLVSETIHLLQFYRDGLS